MTPAQAAAALFETMPQPVSVVQLAEYGLNVAESQAQAISREILSLNLYWILAAIDAHIPLEYRASICEILLESIKTRWLKFGQFGGGSWDDYLKELNERRVVYTRLVDQEGMSHMAVSAETASLIEDRGIVPSEDRTKLLVLLIDYAPAAQYGKLLEVLG